MTKKCSVEKEVLINTDRGKGSANRQRNRGSGKQERALSFSLGGCGAVETSQTGNS